MLRLRSGASVLRRLLHLGSSNRDQVLEQLRVCSAEDQLLDVVGRHKAELTLSHVSCAVNMLWDFQEDKPSILRTPELSSHPHFLILKAFAENNIPLMNDTILVDFLYHFLRLRVDPCDTFVQQMVSEAWHRLDRFPMDTLSRFSTCLTDRHIQKSPLMGRITCILHERLSSTEDIRALSTLMYKTSYLQSPRLQDALVKRALELFVKNEQEPKNIKRMLWFLRRTKYSNQPLLEKCFQLTLPMISELDLESISLIVGMYPSLQNNRSDFKLALKERLIEVMDYSSDPVFFCKLFVRLGPMASLEIRERLENTAFLLADELSAKQALTVAEALSGIRSKNLPLLDKIASVIQRNLHSYKRMEVYKITKAFHRCFYKNQEFSTELRHTLLNFLQHSILPEDVSVVTRALNLLPVPSSVRLEEVLQERVEAVADQCKLGQLSSISLFVTKLVRHSPTSKYVRLLQTLNRCSLERVQTSERLDLLLEELKSTQADWFEDMLLEETIVVLQRMMDQMNWKNALEVCDFLARTNRLCPLLMDRIASVVIEKIDEMQVFSAYTALLPFTLMNYDPPQADKFFEVCTQHFICHIRSIDPPVLILVANSLSMALRFPEELIREIFSVDFLRKLDFELETWLDSSRTRIRQNLMELNRAVCLECPEFQVPWFHESYCQQLRQKWNGSLNPMKQHVHKLLAEVLGGINFVQVAVITPYGYTIDFEFIVDKYLQPLPYATMSTLQIFDRGEDDLELSSLGDKKQQLPPGAQRVAVNVLASKSFCKNSHHLRSKSLVKRRHLEILGYRVIEIPYFEWNSMELSTQGAWKEYLKKKISTELAL